MSAPYRAAGEDVWERQAGVREVRREADNLAAAQAIQYAKLLEETEADRRLCNAAFEAGFIEHKIEATLIQKEVADDIRLQSERIGVPWRGLSVEELIEVLRETADERRDDLRKLLAYTEDMQRRGKLLADTAQRRVEVLDDARDEAIAEVQNVIEGLVASLRAREAELVEIAREIARQRSAMLTKGLGALARVQEVSVNLLEEGHLISAKDDLHLLAELFERREDLDGSAEEIDAALMRVKREQEEDEALGAAAEAPKDEDGSESKNETKKMEAKIESDDAPSFKAPKIEFRFDRWMLQRVAMFGTVGSLEKLRPLDLSRRPLRWDANRSDMHVLTLSDEDVCATHTGDQDAKASMFGSDGFSEGTIVMRIVFEGLLPGQWVSAGVATAAQLNGTAFVRDAVIFEVARSSTTQSATTGYLSQQSIENESVVTIVLDSQLRTIEYYKSGVRLKVVVLERLPGARENIYFFPFCTLFHPGQMARLTP
ncbi:Hypothetical Protein FCC1311_062182 [Hondaea fermentalgiana]|uniref:Uncharacterized protein n=1 Tax=Hondaea fermentalgiana TaxID=2315210 RepID=A0A2R5GJT8_9STRA|nr:Hypothetical Protein FCC1311_062182 [Hondaea fermentalgiana]|eukprot:GBG29998.1 Hypothetical Protein FCC1311_062182 [Hondaea fermentalgiana]